MTSLLVFVMRYPSVWIGKFSKFIYCSIRFGSNNRPDICLKFVGILEIWKRDVFMEVLIDKYYFRDSNNNDWSQGQETRNKKSSSFDSKFLIWFSWNEVSCFNFGVWCAHCARCLFHAALHFAHLLVGHLTKFILGLLNFFGLDILIFWQLFVFLIKSSHHTFLYLKSIFLSLAIFFVSLYLADRFAY